MNLFFRNGITLSLGRQSRQFSAHLQLEEATTDEEQKAIFTLLEELIGNKPDRIEAAKKAVSEKRMDADRLKDKLIAFANELEEGYVCAHHELMGPKIAELL